MPRNLIFSSLSLVVDSLILCEIDNLIGEFMRTGISLGQKRDPREGRDASKPGAYQLATRVTDSMVDPGGQLEFSQYITGYGNIGASKIVCFMSEGIFDQNESIYKTSLGKTKEGKDIFGINVSKMDMDGILIELSGLKQTTWTHPTLYFDLEMADCPFVATEYVLENPPFYFNLKLKDKVRPGEYVIDFYFTYYNGDKWVCNKESVKFKVRNFFERYTTRISWFGISASIAGLILGVIRLVNRG